MDLSQFIGSATVGAIFGAVITAIATLRVAARQIQIDNVTKERTKWRSHIRKLAHDLSQAIEQNDDRTIRLITHDIQLQLNPSDPPDQEIVSALRKLFAATPQEKRVFLEEVVARLALLLKHDWERAKHETRFTSRIRTEPRRVPYTSNDAELAAQIVHKPKEPKTLLWLALMTGAASIIFILGASLSKSIAEAVTFFNDPNQHPSAHQWAFVILFALGVGAIWSMLHLIFKVSEKILTDEAMRSMKR